MSLKVATGSTTTIWVANTKMIKEIQVATEVNTTEGAASTFLRAIGKKRPVYGYVEINDTPVTGNLNIIKSDNYDFLKVLRGLGDTDTYDGSTLSLAKPFYMLLRHSDNNTSTEFRGTWIPLCNADSDQENVPVKGALTSQYNISASMIVDIPNKSIIEKVTATSGTATLSHTPVLFNGKEFFPAGVDSDGNFTHFVVDVTNGTVLSDTDWSVSSTSLTVPTDGDYLVAYQYSA